MTRYFSSTAICVVLAALTALTLRSDDANAHEIRPTIAELSKTNDRDFEVTISANLEALIAEIGIEHDDTDESVNAGEYDRLRALSPMALKSEFDAFAPRLLAGIVLSAEETRLPISLIDVEVPEIGDVELARVSIVRVGGRLPATTTALTWSYATEFGDSVIRLREERAAPDGDASEITYVEYLQAGEISQSFSFSGAPPQRIQDVFVDYIGLGFTHILPKGLDHILFVVGLFLLSTQLSVLLWQITSFTLAHSITLALGMLDVVQVSPSIVEPLIAASIVYVCIENIVTDKLHTWRPFVIFGFGLLHGLGFAGVLSEIGLHSSQFITGLVAFNVGVELGQISVVVICFLAVGLWFRAKPWYRTAVTLPLSAVIALIGAWWFVERTLF